MTETTASVEKVSQETMLAQFRERLQKLLGENQEYAKKIKDNEAYILIKKKKITKSNYYFLSKKGDLKEAAKNLYSTLRKIKKNQHLSIAVSKIPNKGLGKTINDRLLRASKY